MKLLVDNSFCKVEGQLTADANQLLCHIMTYKNEIESEKGQLFYQMKVAKAKGNQKMVHAIKAKIEHLEKNEYVCLFKNNMFPTGLLNIAIEALNALRVQYQFVDQRLAPGASAILRWSNVPWNPRYYQQEMIKIGLEAGRGVFEAAVGSGKSLIMAYLIHAISATSLIVVPSRALSTQLFNDFTEWFGSHNVELLDASKIRKLKKPKAISIVTVQSLGSLVKTGEFSAFAQHIDALFVDEVHHAGATTYTSLLKDLEHVYYRYGFSGTFLRADSKTLEMWSFLSNVLYQYPAWKAVEEGFLTPLQVHIHNIKGRPNRNYQKEYDAHYCANPALLEKIVEILDGIPADSQVLILVKQKDKCGLVIHEYLNSLGIKNTYLSGDNSSVEINNGIINFNDKKISLLIGSSVFGEGVDIRSTDHLIMCNGGKSEIAIVQAIGRVVRLFPGKEIAHLHDFRFESTKYMTKHCDERLEIYDRNFKASVCDF